MQALFGGTGINEENIRAFRRLCIEQFGPLVEKEVRDEFIDFYTKKINEALNLRMKLLQTEVDPKGEPYMRASDRFFKIIENYFQKLAQGPADGKWARHKSKKRTASGKKIKSNEDEDDSTDSLTDEIDDHRNSISTTRRKNANKGGKQGAREKKADKFSKFEELEKNLRVRRSNEPY